MTKTSNPTRQSAQSEAHRIVSDVMDLAGQDCYDRDEARDQIGKSWTNISTLYPHPEATIKELYEALDALHEAGFVCYLETENRQTVIEVKVTKSVIDRNC